MRATVLPIMHRSIFDTSSVSSLCEAALSRTESLAVHLYFQSSYISLPIALTRQSKAVLSQSASFFYRKCTRRFHHIVKMHRAFQERELRDLSRNICTSCISSTFLLFSVLTLSDIYVDILIAEFDILIFSCINICK